MDLETEKQGKVTLLFSANWYPVSLLIQLLTWSRWSHCDIVMEDGSLIGACIPKGVIAYPVSKRLKAASRHTYRTIDANDSMYDFARAEIGKKYDYRGIAGLEFRRHWQDSDAWFCSELIGAAAVFAGNLKIVKKVFRLTPGDLYKYSDPI